MIGRRIENREVAEKFAAGRNRVRSSVANLIYIPTNSISSHILIPTGINQPFIRSRSSLGIIYVSEKRCKVQFSSRTFPETIEND